MKNKFQHKLYNYEASPPENIWSKIATALDDSHLKETFPAKLYNLESTPPAGIWGKISFTLSQQPEAPPLVKRNYAPFYRYAAAAIIIGLISFAAIWIINYSYKKDPVALFNKSSNTEMDKTTGKPIEPASNPVALIVNE